MNVESATALGVVVVSYRSAHLLAQNLAPLDLAAVGGVDVVIVDNWSSDAERRRVEELTEANGWSFVGPPANVGFGAAINLGASVLLDRGCQWLLVLNPDVRFEVEEIVKLVRGAGGRPGAYAPRIVRPDGSIWFAGGQLDMRRGLTTTRPDLEQRDPDRWLTAACLLVHQQTWRLVGGFDEDYFMYWEDLDLSRRVLEVGHDLRVVHDVVVEHQVGGTQEEGGGKTSLYCRYNCRNRLLFAARHARAGERWRWVAASPRYAARVLLRGGRGAALRPSLVLGATRGTLEGLALVASRRRDR